MHCYPNVINLLSRRRRRPEVTYLCAIPLMFPWRCLASPYVPPRDGFLRAYILYAAWRTSATKIKNWFSTRHQQFRAYQNTGKHVRPLLLTRRSTRGRVEVASFMLRQARFSNTISQNVSTFSGKADFSQGNANFVRYEYVLRKSPPLDIIFI